MVFSRAVSFLFILTLVAMVVDTTVELVVTVVVVVVADVVVTDWKTKLWN